MEMTMRATLTFSADTEEILEDVALILKNRIRSYNRAVNSEVLQNISDRLSLASVDQLQDVVLDIARLRTQLAKLDFALEDSIKIAAGYYQAMTAEPEEPTTNDEV
tara:strand:+ start:1400 stop:1717 length:318 start_codon:yes stop_codon:yes gene_type:complete